MNNNYIMRLTLYFFISIILFSCSNKLRPGKYVCSDYGNISIDKANNYQFEKNSGIHRGSEMFSKGTIKVVDKTVIFLPDSSFFLHISVSKYYFDKSIKDSLQIIIKNAGANNLPDFVFSIDDPSQSDIPFEKDTIMTYKPLNNHDDIWLILNAKLKDTVIPLPKHSVILSNLIKLIDVNNDDSEDKPWNVLVLNINISKRMFAFVTLPPYSYKKGSLIEKMPVYKLEK